VILRDKKVARRSFIELVFVVRNIAKKHCQKVPAIEAVALVCSSNKE